MLLVENTIFQWATSFEQHTVQWWKQVKFLYFYRRELFSFLSPTLSSHLLLLPLYISPHVFSFVFFLLSSFHTLVFPLLPSVSGEEKLTKAILRHSRPDPAPTESMGIFPLIEVGVGMGPTPVFPPHWRQPEEEDWIRLQFHLEYLRASMAQEHGTSQSHVQLLLFQ